MPLFMSVLDRLTSCVASEGWIHRQQHAVGGIFAFGGLAVHRQFRRHSIAWLRLPSALD